MNTLFNRSQKIFNLRRIKLDKFLTNKSFTAVVQMNKNQLQEGENSEIVIKLIQRDETFFINLSNTKGPLHALQKLDNVVSSFDNTTKLGRDIHRIKDEMVTRLAYNQRTVEEHEHVSTHICENELQKVYSEHLKTLQSRVFGLNSLTSNSTEESQIVYEYSTSAPKYTLIPALSTLSSVFLINYYSAGLIYSLGALSPFILSLAAVYAGLKRMQWLRAGDSLAKGSVLVKKMSFNGNTIRIQSFNRKTYNLDFASTTIKRVDNQARREVFFIVKDLYQSSMFILPITENVVANEKSLDWFTQMKKTNDEYSIRHVLSLGDKKTIDLNKQKNIRSEIETLTRINVLAAKGVDLSILSSEEISQKINAVSDIEVGEFIKYTNEKLAEKTVPSLESNLVSVENLFTSFGINSDEAVKLTKYLRDNFKINNVKDLSYLNGNELTDAYAECVKNSEVPFKSLRTNLDVFFKSLSN